MTINIDALKGRRAQILSSGHTDKSAVLLPLINQESEWSILFEKRAAHIKRQPGEICFPGGRMDLTDNNPGETAIRETCEELSLGVEDLELIAPLDIMVSPFNSIIYPYVGIIKNPDKINPSLDEVERVFCVPLSFFMENAPLTEYLSMKVTASPDYPFDLIPHGKNYPFREAKFPGHFYIWDSETIWGLTARILHHFITLVKNP